MKIGQSGGLDAKRVAFDSGVDDDLARPFEDVELTARLRAPSRRRRPPKLQARGFG